MSDPTPELTREDFDRIRPKLIALLAPKGVRGDELEDLIQETFLEAHRSRTTFKGGSELDTWVVSIGKHVWLHHVRGRRAAKRDRRQIELEPWQFEEALATENPQTVPASPETVAMDRQKLERARRAITRLPDKLRQPLLMKVDGNPVKKIAAVLGITPELVTSRIHQAREKLRRLFPERQRSPSR